ncbi:MAG: cobalt ECF transporter T component CbiQ [Prolixibacteraceae bacterium]
MIPSFLIENETIEPASDQGKNRHAFIDKTIGNTAAFVSATFFQWKSSGQPGLLQKTDSRAKVVFLLLFIVLISLTHTILIQLALATMFLLLCLLSKINVFHLYKKVAIIGFFFGFLIFIPASLNLFTKGEAIVHLVKFSRPHQFWIYTLPQEITVTKEGLLLVALLTMRVINSVSLVLIIVSATTFERLIKSLAFFKVPNIFLLTLTLTYKFIFLLSSTIIETYQAIKMRWWNRGSVKEAENIVAGRIGYLFRKSWERHELTYQAMLARGFNGKLNFYSFERFKWHDYLFLGATIVLFLLFILINYRHVGTL